MSATENGLVFASDARLPFEDWVALGSQLKRMNRFTALCVGDWLAYGDSEYCEVQWKRMPQGVYSQAAKIMGVSEGYLRNLKSACSRVGLSCRSDKVTAGHLIEIVAKSPPNRYTHWSERVETEDLSVKGLRDALKAAQSKWAPEPHDTGTTTFLEKARQFARDYSAECGKWDKSYRAEIRRALAAILDDLAE